MSMYVCMPVFSYRHLELLKCGGCEFAFQMLLLLFCREVGWDSTMLLWESLWAAEVGKVVDSVRQVGSSRQ